jgi:hypothetical protein
MKTKTFRVFHGLQKVTSLLSFLLIIGWMPAYSAEKQTDADTASYLTCRGVVTDATTGNPLSYASVLVEGTNIGTVTNAEGRFLLKVAQPYATSKILVSYIGFQNLRIPVAEFGSALKKIPMKISEVSLSEVKVVFKDAETLLRSVFDKARENYVSDPTVMRAFYRESVKAGGQYASLLEAVVDILKYPMNSSKGDVASIYKMRKSSNYELLDTVELKLAGGPYNILYLDVMKNIESVFSDKMFVDFDFKLSKATMVDDRLVYVVDFNQKKSVKEPMYYGKLYIDAVNLAMFSAQFDLNLSNPEAATGLFVVRNSPRADVTLTKAKYRVNYVLRDGKWYMAYGRTEMGFKVNWIKKKYKTDYEAVYEMAITDWAPYNTAEKFTKTHPRLHTDVVLSDEAQGFSDPAFWGDENIIEPSKSIDAAIAKIQSQLKRK